MGYCFSSSSLKKWGGFSSLAFCCSFNIGRRRWGRPDASLHPKFLSSYQVLVMGM
ncbi:MAG: hypothetical protein MGG37_19135 [Trichodesmium sp. MAG_R01]|nr:hypothetical protein [Trichodesmium sp. MAG_R01]